jgi:endonuclease/exonuclease/phosphatase family metal-dependent hydrolase
MQLSVLTWNIHKGFSSGNGSFVLHRMRELLREMNVDLVFLQEVFGEHRGHAARIHDWPEVSQFEFLADQVWHHHAYGKNAIADDRHHGNAILSKYPFSRSGNINVALFRQASRSLLHGTLEIPETGKRIHVLCLHLGLFGFERRQQLRILNQHLERAAANHDAVILGGDFNDWTSRQVQRVLDPTLGLREAFMQTHQRYARTFPARWPLLCVDRIYFSGLELESCQCLNSPSYRDLSDHVPLLARFRVSTTTPQ